MLSASCSQRHLLLSPALLWLHLRGHRNHRIRVTSPLTCSSVCPPMPGTAGCGGRQACGEAPTPGGRVCRRQEQAPLGGAHGPQRLLGRHARQKGEPVQRPGRWAAGWDQAEWTGGESWSEARGLAKVRAGDRGPAVCLVGVGRKLHTRF